eukprot:CAMPEP_0170784646 /NCGR_PEP_ID=MMETSP0733-20121128/16340_1 /TAXON_ID=186038 /ORGANISM="Fragilariopsis kerguelensis, Strain L26-C5" /LENGTH=46 /DNA_ID= /DNA_START= /DNA_END= /DNA_ORIENTATION=
MSATSPTTIPSATTTITSIYQYVDQISGDCGISISSAVSNSNNKTS